MGNTSGNCKAREGVLNSAPRSVLISRRRGRGAPREGARGLRVIVILAVDKSEHALAATRLLRALNERMRTWCSSNRGA